VPGVVLFSRASRPSGLRQSHATLGEGVAPSKAKWGAPPRLSEKTRR
jgi:hypothetical protein